MSATVSESAPTTSDPQSPYVRLNGTAGSQKRGLVDVERRVPIGANASVIHADLYLYQAEAFAGTETITVTPINATWDSATATWNTRPALRASTATKTLTSAGADATPIVINVTSLIAEAVAADDASGTRWYGLEVKTSGTADKKIYGTYGPEAYRPYLNVEWSEPPAPPSDLQPSSGLATGDVRPYLLWSFFDPDAEDTIAQVQVQVSTVDTFATTVYDSGAVAHTKPFFDMAAPPTGSAAVTDLTVGTTYYWRAKHADNHGIWSEYSAPASFVPRAKGTLTLSSPGATVSTPTPTITWSYTGTQSSYEVEVSRKVDGVWQTHRRWAKTVGTATSVTLDDSLALQEGESYKVEVRVWPTQAFADLPGDRAFVSASQEFTLSAAS